MRQHQDRHVIRSLLLALVLALCTIGWSGSRIVRGGAGTTGPVTLGGVVIGPSGSNTLNVVTVATLAACDAAHNGFLAMVTDATVASCSGGYAVAGGNPGYTCPVYCGTTDNVTYAWYGMVGIPPAPTPSMTPTATPTPAVGRGIWQWSGQNDGNHPNGALAFDLNDSGNVVPRAVIAGIGVIDTVRLDKSLNIWIMQNGAGTISEYSYGTNSAANPPPYLTVGGTNTGFNKGINGMNLDANGDLWVNVSTGVQVAGDMQSVLAKFTVASLVPGLNNVAPAMTIPFPTVLGVNFFFDASNNMYASYRTPTTNQYFIGKWNAGNVTNTPDFNIPGKPQGTLTTLSVPGDMALDSANNLWVNNIVGSHGWPTKFAAGMWGDVAPIGIISGNFQALSGLSIGPNDDIYVMDHSNGGGALFRYPAGLYTPGPTPTALASPSLVITGSLTRLAYPVRGAIEKPTPSPTP